MNELPDEDKTLKQEQEKAGEEQFTEGVLEEQSSEEVTGSEDAAPEMDIGMETGPDPEVTKEKESKMEIESDGTVRDEAVSPETKTEASNSQRKAHTLPREFFFIRILPERKSQANFLQL